VDAPDKWECEMNNRENRIREKAQHLWEQAGRPGPHPERHRAEAERLIDAEDRKADRRDDKRKHEDPERAVDIGPSPDGDITTVNIPPSGFSR
jgi:hypothetical protein